MVLGFGRVHFGFICRRSTFPQIYTHLFFLRNLRTYIECRIDFRTSARPSSRGGPIGCSTAPWASRPTSRRRTPCSARSPPPRRPRSARRRRRQAAAGPYITSMPKPRRDTRGGRGRSGYNWRGWWRVVGEASPPPREGGTTTRRIRTTTMTTTMMAGPSILPRKPPNGTAISAVGAWIPRRGRTRWNLNPTRWRTAWRRWWELITNETTTTTPMTTEVEAGCN